MTMPDTATPRNDAPIIDVSLSGIRRFLFAPEVPYGMALVRIFLPLTLFGTMVIRWPWIREIYSSDGSPTPLAHNFGFPEFLPELPPGAAVALNTLLMFTLLTSSLGWCTRISLVISLVLHYYFGMIDSLSTITKYSVIATHMLLLLSVSDCGSVWSVDAWLSGRNRRGLFPDIAPVRPARTPAWPRRLMQIMVGVVYLGAAITKMHTAAFFNGDQLLFWLMTHYNHAHPVGEHLTQYPAIIVMSAYTSIIWEVSFLFAAWRGWGRLIMLTLGVLFHIGTFLMLGLIAFPLIMVTIYFAWLTESEIQHCAKLLRRWKRQWLPRAWRHFTFSPAGWVPRFQQPRWSPQVTGGVCAAMALLLSVTAVGIERQMDVYDMQRPEGPHQLRELSPDEVARFFGKPQPLREEDKFFSFQVGTIIVAGRLADNRRVFRPGDQVICEANLNPPHADMWIECNLHDGEDRVISKLSQVIPRESTRGHYIYRLSDALVSGEYAMVLKSRGKEIARRKFTLQGGLPSPVAN